MPCIALGSPYTLILPLSHCKCVSTHRNLRLLPCPPPPNSGDHSHSISSYSFAFIFHHTIFSILTIISFTLICGVQSLPSSDLLVHGPNFCVFLHIFNSHDNPNSPYSHFFMHSTYTSHRYMLQFSNNFL